MFFGMFHHVCACVRAFVCIFFSVEILRFRECMFVVGGGVGVAVAVSILLLFYITHKHTAKAQKANTHLNIKMSYWCKHTKEKLRFNRWPLVHFIQLALISHCRCSIQISFLSFGFSLVGRFFGTLVRSPGHMLL